jgi:hypothetical protein
MSKLLCFIPLLFLSIVLKGQLMLHPSIGLNQLPSDNESVCYIPVFNGSFYTSGISEGDTAADFKLYSLTGDSIVLSEVLNSGKPVLMIAGSYTCPVFRNKLININNVVNNFGGLVEVFIVYTIEAHPIVDTSVYFGYVNPGAQNINEGILYRQPTTYGERKAIVQEMLSALTVPVNVYLDGPCNQWWNYYGPAPNNAYLINTDGTVFAKHGWFDKFPENIICDIDSLLGNPVSCTGTGASGFFNFNMITGTTVYGSPGSTITLSGELVNSGTTDVIVDIYRLQNNMPSGWASSLCADVCYPTTTDTATIMIPAGSIQTFHFYIYSDHSIDTARARVGFRNAGNSNNQYARNLFGITNSTTSVMESEYLSESGKLYPNPASGRFYYEPPNRLRGVNYYVTLTDVAGRIVRIVRNLKQEIRAPVSIDRSGLNPGAYLFRIVFDSGEVISKHVVVVE